MSTDIVVGKTSGFCFGCKRAIEGVENELKKDNHIYCLGEIIHNEEVIKNLSQKGLITINNINEATNKLIIRTHGTTKEVYEIAKRNNIEILDFTCPFVLNIHNQIIKYSKKNYFIFILGIKNHPETNGNLSFCVNNSYLIENVCDVQDAIKSFKSSELNNLLIISQTTFNQYVFNEIIENVLSNISSNIHVEIKNTICNTTSLRQNETDEISKEVDFMIVIGGKKSSNTKKLYEISSNNCKNTVLIQTYKDLKNINFKKFSKIGIIAGASTPQYIIDDTVNYLKQ